MTDERDRRDQRGDLVASDEIYARLKEHADIGIIDSVRPAGPSGWIVSIGGQDRALTDQAQALTWLSAVDAVLALLDRQMSGGGDWPTWLYWIIRSRRGPGR